MGLGASEVLAMPLHDYQAALHHYAKAQGGDDDADALGEEDFDEMLVSLAASGKPN